MLRALACISSLALVSANLFPGGGLNALAVDPDCGKCLAIGDIILTLDRSGSINEAEWKTLKNSASGLVSDFRVSESLARFGVSTFAVGATTELYIGSTKSAKELIVKAAIKTAEKGPDGQLTNFFAALSNFKNQQLPGMRPDVAKVLILFTDGKPTTGPGIAAITALANEIRAIPNVGIVAVGIGSGVNATFLTSISDLYIPESGFDFDLINNEYFRDACQFVTCAPTVPPTQKPTTPRTTKAPTSQPTEHPTEMPTERPTIQCKPPKNVLFIFDASNTVGDSFFSVQKDYVKGILDQMDLSWNKNNVAMEFISDKILVATDYNDAYTGIRAQLKTRLDNLKFLGGYTNLPASAARAKHVLNQMPAYRKGLNTIVILLSDGFPQLAEYKSPKLRKKAMNAFDYLKYKMAVDVQAVAVGNKYYKNAANQAMMAQISAPFSVVAIEDPYPASITDLFGPACEY